MTYAFLDEAKATYGVEPICRVLQVAPSRYRTHRPRPEQPDGRSARAERDETLRTGIQRVWVASRRVHGVRKVRRRLRREGHAVARCTVARLMRAEVLRGVVRGRRMRTTVPEPVAERPLDLEQRRHAAGRPNQLPVADLAYVATWRGFVHVALVVDVFPRRMVGWRASASMRSDPALDALEQAIHDRETDGGLMCHTDRGAHHLSIRHTERLAEAGIAASVGSRGDSYHNALVESVIGLSRTEVVRHGGLWRGLEDV